MSTIETTNYSGLCDFACTDGMHKRVTWVIKRSPKHSRVGIRRGHIVYMIITVNGNTTCLFDEHWKKSVFFFTDPVTKAFYSMLLELYN